MFDLNSVLTRFSSRKPASYELLVLNPSKVPRKGHISVPWQPIHAVTKIAPNELQMKQLGKIIPFQIDNIDPNDPSQQVLVFSLAGEIEPGDDNYSAVSGRVSLEQGESTSSHEHAPKLVVCSNGEGDPRGVKLINNRLNIFLNLTPELEPYLPKCYAGAITSFQLDSKEMLDAFCSATDEPFFYMYHDPEKRLQLASIRLWSPAWENHPFQQVHLFNRSYQLLSTSTGPVRACVTIASEPFEYPYMVPFAENKYYLECRLYRTLSVYEDSDYLLEELWVKGQLSNNKSVDLHFEPHYFSNMDIGIDPKQYRFREIPDWFAVGYPFDREEAPHPGFGFATDVHTASLNYPDPNFPNRAKDYRTFSWSLQPSKAAKCLSFFMWGHPAGFDDQTGRYWHDFIYKPLRAKLKESQ